MAVIEHAGQVHEEYDWLTQSGLVDKWYVYLKKWCAARDLLATIEFNGEEPLADVVRDMQRYIDDEYGIEYYPNIIISGVPIEQFYPNVRENMPKEIVFFDGGNWYMSELQECADYLNGTLRI